MNLNNVVAPLVGAVSPPLVAQYQQSTGSTPGADFKQIPTYAAAVPVTVQVQMLSYQDLKQLEGVNMGGEKRAIYVSGDWRAVSRPDARGGDLITMADGRVWLVVQVLENWADIDGWCKVAVTLQGAS